MKTQVIAVAVVILFLTNVNCKDPQVTQPVVPKQITISTDRSSYYFSTSTFRDALFITLFNNSDSTVYSWFPTYLYLKVDTGWEWQVIWDGAFYNTIRPGQSMTTPWFVHTDSIDHFPNGTYRIVAQMYADTAATSRHFVLRSTPEFTLKYK